jgi:sarcosine oxidase gamma subunit
MKRKVQLIIPILMALCMLIGLNSYGQKVIAYWDQNSNNLPGGGFGFLADPDVFPQAADMGTGTLSSGGGLLSETTTNTNGDLVYTWIQSFGGSTINAQPGVASGGSIAIQGGTDNGNNGAYFQFQISMTNFLNLNISYATQRTSTGFNSQTWSWSTDGTTFTDFHSVTTIPSSFGLIEIDAPVALDNEPTVYLRITFDGASAATGNNRLDNITFSGDLLPFATYFHLGVLDGSRPAWMVEGGHTERGLTADATSVYVASRNAGTHVLVLNRLTGLQTGTLNTTGITGGTFALNDIEVTADGVLIAGNLSLTSAAGQNGNFKLYIVDDTDPAQELITYTWSHDEVGAKRFGDKFTVVGSMSDGSAMVFAANGSAPQVLKWSMIPGNGKNWVFDQTPEVITLVDVTAAATPVVAPLPDGTFYWTASGRNVTKHAADGSLIGTIPGGILATGTTAMKFLGHEGTDEILAVYWNGLNNELARVVRVVDGVPDDTELIFDTPSLRGESTIGNPNGTGDVAFVPYPDGNTAIYVLGTNIGIGGYASLGLDLEFPVYEPFVSPTARIQIIHNSADAAVDEVDIYVNGDLFLEDFAFRTATPFVSVPAGVDLNIIVAPAGAGIANGVGPVTVNLTEGETYIAIANGIVSATGYDPATAFSLDVFPAGREAATVATNTDVLVFHGSTDAPTVSVWETGVGAGELFTFSYGDFAGYLELGTADYVLEIRTADGETTVVAYSAPLATLGLDGAAITVVASGFLDPANNSAGPAFGLYVALASGGDLIALPVYTETFEVTFNVDMTFAEDFDPAMDVVYITGSIFGWAEPGTQPENQTMTRVGESMVWTKTLHLEAGTYEYKYFLNAGWDGGEWPGGANRVLVVEDNMEVNDWFGYIDGPPTARIQIIHNSADAAVDEVDIYVNGDLFLEDFAFRTATPFVDVPARVDLDIVVAPAGAGIANGVGPVTVNLTEGETYIAIANGIVSATGYDPATAFSLDVFPAGREAATVATNTDVLVFHGSTDAPTVSVWETGVGAGELFTFSYGDFAGYLELGTADYVLEIRTADGETTVVAYSAPLATLGLDGAAITVVASGFLDPANNSAGPAFGLYVALASGGNLIALPVYTETFEVTFNVNMTYAEGFDPATDVVYLTGSILGWAEPGTDPDNQTMTRDGETMIWTKTLQLEAGTYAYKYFLNAGWGGGEWQGGDDRALEVEDDMEVNDWFGSLTDPTSITDPSLAQIRVFPVPARTTLYITSPELIRDLRIIDMVGQVVYSANVAGMEHEVHVGGFKNGIYFVRSLPTGASKTAEYRCRNNPVC